jgi:hypothetical protein
MIWTAKNVHLQPEVNFWPQGEVALHLSSRVQGATRRISGMAMPDRPFDCSLA